MNTNPQPVLVDTAAAAHAVGRKPADIRRWAQRGLFQPVGTDTHPEPR